MAELDDLLRASLTRSMQPGDSTGVADLIRARVDSGDRGTPAATSGYGATRGWPTWWVGLLAMFLVVGMVVGGGLVAERVTSVASNGGPGVAAPTVSPTASTTETPRPTAPAAAPPAAPVAPAEPTPEPPAEEQAPPPPPPVVEPSPTPTSPPPPPVDTIAPSIVQYWASTGQVCSDPQPGWDTAATLGAVVIDDVGVAGVSASWALDGGSSGFSGSGDTWLGTFDPSSGSEGLAEITIVAWDAAGNVSAPVLVAVQVWSLGNCLI